MSQGLFVCTQLNGFKLLVGWLLWHINLRRLFNPKSIFMKIVLFQTIQFSISTQFKWGKFLFQAIQFSQAVLIQLIQFSTSTDFVYTQLNVKHFNQLSVSTVSMSKNSSISNNSV